jgi:SagB-type dehydrogenase family enzyme
LEEKIMEDQFANQFLEMTKSKNIPPSAQSQGLPQPPLELPVPDGLQMIDLPAPQRVIVPPMELRLAVEKRETLRAYVDENISLDELSYLLWTTQGVKTVTDRPVTKRTVPSAGSRHAFETWLLVNRVDGLQPGLYRYVAIRHQLIRVPAVQDIRQKLTDACGNQKHVFESAVTFFWVAVVERMTWRYPARGYRFLFLDAGHVCQNLYLAAEQLGCGVCAIAAFDDDLVNQALQVNGKDLFTVYIASLGRRAK